MRELDGRLRGHSEPGHCRTLWPVDRKRIGAHGHIGGDRDGHRNLRRSDAAAGLHGEACLAERNPTRGTQIFAGDYGVEAAAGHGTAGINRGAGLSFRVLDGAKHLLRTREALGTRCATGDDGNRFARIEQGSPGKASVGGSDAHLAATEGNDCGREIGGLKILFRPHDSANRDLGVNLEMAIRRSDFGNVRPHLSIDQFKIRLLLSRIMLRHYQRRLRTYVQDRSILQAHARSAPAFGLDRVLPEQRHILFCFVGFLLAPHRARRNQRGDLPRSGLRRCLRRRGGSKRGNRCQK